jgi:glycosyltransferase involved in cell wall biosynthesis
VNIWLIRRGGPIPIKNNVRKMRTAILADKLLGRGHKVFWWTSAFLHRQKINIASQDTNINISEGYIIRALRGWKYKKHVSLARYIDHFIVALKFRFQANKYAKPDVIVIAMPDHLLAYEAARYAWKNDIPFLVDIRDLWPDIFISRFKENGWLYRIGKAVLVFDYARLTFMLKRAAGLVAVSQGYLNWGLAKINRKQTALDKVFFIGYKKSAPKSPVSGSENPDIPVWLKERKGQKIFLFVGTFGVSYELELILAAARHFEQAGRTDICFILAGAGEKLGLISKTAAGLSNVVLPGWIGTEEISALLSLAYAGLVPCRSAENTVPNKPFEYLSAGLPLISSLEGEMAEFIDQNKIGFNYLPGDLERLCQCIGHLASDPALHQELSKNALRFFDRYGDADKIYDEYCQLIEQLV